MNTHSETIGKEEISARRETTGKEEIKINVKMKLSALWAALMLMYIYADWFSLFRTGQIEEMMSGRMGPFLATQGSLFAFSFLMIIPPVMIFLSLALKSKAGRWSNIIFGGLYTLVNIGNLIGETWAYYFLFGIVEILFTSMIVGYAWKWRSPEGQLQQNGVLIQDKS